MPLVIRIPKTTPDLSRRDALEQAREIARAKGYTERVLRRSASHMERVEGSVPWEYVIEFPDTASPTPVA